MPKSSFTETELEMLAEALESLETHETLTQPEYRTHTSVTNKVQALLEGE